MAMIKGNGKPTRKTKGAIGDIYTDRSTGRMYKCVFAYRGAFEEEFDCQWREIQSDGKVEAETVAEETKVEAVAEPMVEEAPVKEEPKQESRPNYHKQYSKTNK